MKYIRILFLFILSTNLYAMDKNGNYAIWGVGSKPCHGYNLARAADDYDNYKNYIMGFLTAYNIVTPDTYRISGDMKMNDILIWLDDECGLKPIVSFEEILRNFVNESYDKRIKSPPVRTGR